MQTIIVSPQKGFDPTSRAFVYSYGPGDVNIESVEIRGRIYVYEYLRLPADFVNHPVTQVEVYTKLVLGSHTIVGNQTGGRVEIGFLASSAWAHQPAVKAASIPSAVSIADSTYLGDADIICDGKYEGWLDVTDSFNALKAAGHLADGMVLLAIRQASPVYAEATSNVEVQATGIGVNGETPFSLRITFDDGQGTTTPVPNPALISLGCDRNTDFILDDTILPNRNREPLRPSVLYSLGFFRSASSGERIAANVIGRHPQNGAASFTLLSAKYHVLQFSAGIEDSLSAAQRAVYDNSGMLSCDVIDFTTDDGEEFLILGSTSEFDSSDMNQLRFCLIIAQRVPFSQTVVVNGVPKPLFTGGIGKQVSSYLQIKNIHWISVPRTYGRGIISGYRRALISSYEPTVSGQWNTVLTEYSFDTGTVTGTTNTCSEVLCHTSADHRSWMVQRFNPELLSGHVHGWVADYAYMDVGNVSSGLNFLASARELPAYLPADTPRRPYGNPTDFAIHTGFRWYKFTDGGVPTWMRPGTADEANDADNNATYFDPMSTIGIIRRKMNGSINTLSMFGLNSSAAAVDVTNSYNLSATAGYNVTKIFAPTKKFALQAASYIVQPTGLLASRGYMNKNETATLTIKRVGDGELAAATVTISVQNEEGGMWIRAVNNQVVFAAGSDTATLQIESHGLGTSYGAVLTNRSQIITNKPGTAIPIIIYEVEIKSQPLGYPHMSLDITGPSVVYSGGKGTLRLFRRYTNGDFVHYPEQTYAVTVSPSTLLTVPATYTFKATQPYGPPLEVTGKGAATPGGVATITLRDVNDPLNVDTYMVTVITGDPVATTTTTTTSSTTTTTTTPPPSEDPQHVIIDPTLLFEAVNTAQFVGNWAFVATVDCGDYAFDIYGGCGVPDPSWFEPQAIVTQGRGIIEEEHYQRICRPYDYEITDGAIANFPECAGVATTTTTTTTTSTTTTTTTPAPAAVTLDLVPQGDLATAGYMIPGVASTIRLTRSSASTLPVDAFFIKHSANDEGTLSTGLINFVEAQEYVDFTFTPSETIGDPCSVTITAISTSNSSFKRAEQFSVADPLASPPVPLYTLLSAAQPEADPVTMTAVDTFTLTLLRQASASLPFRRFTITLSRDDGIVTAQSVVAIADDATTTTFPVVGGGSLVGQVTVTCAAEDDPTVTASIDIDVTAAPTTTTTTTVRPDALSILPDGLLETQGYLDPGDITPLMISRAGNSFLGAASVFIERTSTVAGEDISFVSPQYVSFANGQTTAQTTLYTPSTVNNTHTISFRASYSGAAPTTATGDIFIELRENSPVGGVETIEIVATGIAASTGQIANDDPPAPVTLVISRPSDFSAVEKSYTILKSPFNSVTAPNFVTIPAGALNTSFQIFPRGASSAAGDVTITVHETLAPSITDNIVLEMQEYSGTSSTTTTPAPVARSLQILPTGAALAKGFLIGGEFAELTISRQGSTDLSPITCNIDYVTLQDASQQCTVSPTVIEFVQDQLTATVTVSTPESLSVLQDFHVEAEHTGLTIGPNYSPGSLFIEVRPIGDSEVQWVSLYGVGPLATSPFVTLDTWDPPLAWVGISRPSNASLTAQTYDLTVSRADGITVPATVMIPLNATWSQFPITGVGEDGSIGPVTITATLQGSPTVTDDLTITVQPMVFVTTTTTTTTPVPTTTTTTTTTPTPVLAGYLTLHDEIGNVTTCHYAGRTRELRLNLYPEHALAHVWSLIEFPSAAVATVNTTRLHFWPEGLTRKSVWVTVKNNVPVGTRFWVTFQGRDGRFARDYIEVCEQSEEPSLLRDLSFYPIDLIAELGVLPSTGSGYLRIERPATVTQYTVTFDVAASRWDAFYMPQQVVLQWGRTFVDIPLVCWGEVTVLGPVTVTITAETMDPQFSRSLTFDVVDVSTIPTTTTTTTTTPNPSTTTTTTTTPDPSTTTTTTTTTTSCPVRLVTDAIQVITGDDDCGGTWDAVLKFSITRPPVQVEQARLRLVLQEKFGSPAGRFRVTHYALNQAYPTTPAAYTAAKAAATSLPIELDEYVDMRLLQVDSALEINLSSIVAAITAPGVQSVSLFLSRAPRSTPPEVGKIGWAFRRPQLLLIDDQGTRSCAAPTTTTTTAAPTTTTPTPSSCLPMDLMFVTSDHGSMFGWLEDLKAKSHGLFDLLASTGRYDHRFGVVTYRDNDTLQLRQELVTPTLANSPAHLDAEAERFRNTILSIDTQAPPYVSGFARSVTDGMLVAANHLGMFGRAGALKVILSLNNTAPHGAYSIVNGDFVFNPNTIDPSPATTNVATLRSVIHQHGIEVRSLVVGADGDWFTSVASELAGYLGGWLREPYLMDHTTCLLGDLLRWAYIDCTDYLDLVQCPSTTSSTTTTTTTSSTVPPDYDWTGTLEFQTYGVYENDEFSSPLDPVNTFPVPMPYCIAWAMFKVTLTPHTDPPTLPFRATITIADGLQDKMAFLGDNCELTWQYDFIIDGAYPNQDIVRYVPVSVNPAASIGSGVARLFFSQLDGSDSRLLDEITITAYQGQLEDPTLDPTADDYFWLEFFSHDYVNYISTVPTLSARPNPPQEVLRIHFPFVDYGEQRSWSIEVCQPATLEITPTSVEVGIDSQAITRHVDILRPLCAQWQVAVIRVTDDFSGKYQQIVIPVVNP